MPAVSSIRLNHSAAAAAPQDTIEAKRELHNRIREYSAFRGFALQIFVRRIEDLNLLINHCGGTYNSSRITAGTAGCWLDGVQQSEVGRVEQPRDFCSHTHRKEETQFESGGSEGNWITRETPGNWLMNRPKGPFCVRVEYPRVTYDMKGNWLEWGRVGVDCGQKTEGRKRYFPIYYFRRPAAEKNRQKRDASRAFGELLLSYSARGLPKWSKVPIGMKEEEEVNIPTVAIVGKSHIWSGNSGQSAPIKLFMVIILYASLCVCGEMSGLRSGSNWSDVVEEQQHKWWPKGMIIRDVV